MHFFRFFVLSLAAAAQLGGVQYRAVFTPDGLLRPEDVAEAIRPKSPYLTQTSAVCAP